MIFRIITVAECNKKDPSEVKQPFECDVEALTKYQMMI